jgi:hypothetical protein
MLRRLNRNQVDCDRALQPPRCAQLLCMPPRAWSREWLKGDVCQQKSPTSFEPGLFV